MEQREQDLAQRVALAPADADPAGQLPVQGKTALVREAEERGQQQAQQGQVRVRELLAEEQQQERQRLLERKLLEAPSLEAQPRSVQMWNQPELSWQPQLPQLSGPLSVHKPGVPTQENHLPTQTIGIPTLAPLLVGLQKVQVPLVAAQKTDRV
jgi:hypothetical protein